MHRRVLLGGGLAAFGLVSLAGGVLLAWHFREQTKSFFTDADTIDRPAGETSPRDILWRVPLSLPEGVDTPGEECAPSLTGDGQSLYFARRQDGTGFDIFVTTRSASGWSDPAPIAALNSDGDEIDPQVSPDGHLLFFSSDRPGGSGHFDLWVAARGEQGFGPPANMGPSLNGMGNECGPALAPDGAMLYFASDRPRDVPGPPGAERLVVRRDFDIYAARLDGLEPAEPVADLNSAFHETTPAVSPAGDFVYFASDRPGGSGGFDLYRARRLRGAYLPPENLAAPVNTAQEELDPEVGLEGFGLYFVSKSAHAAGDIRYTTSREVFQRTEAWRAAVRWKAVWAALWPYAMWVLAASLLLFLLGKYFTHLEYRKLSLMVRCMMVSLLAHLVLLVIFAYWVVNVPSDREGTGEGVLVSIDLPMSGEGLAAILLGEGTGVTVEPETPQAAPSQVMPWSADQSPAEFALGAGPSAVVPAAASAQMPAAPAPEVAAAQTAAAQVEPAAALAGGLPDMTPRSTSEATIVIREASGSALQRAEPPGISGPALAGAPAPGASDFAAPAAVGAGSPGLAAPPALGVPGAATVEAPHRPAMAGALPEMSPASSGEPTIVVREAAGGGLRRAESVAFSGGGGTGGNAPAPGAADIAGPSAVGAATAGLAAPPALGIPAGSHVAAPARHAMQGALPEAAPASSGEASIVLRQPAGGKLQRAGTQPVSGGAAAMAPSPGAAELPGQAAIGQSPTGVAAPPSMAVPGGPGGAAPVAAPKRTPGTTIRLPDDGSITRAGAGEAEGALQVAPAASHGPGAAPPTLVGKASGIAMPRAHGTAIAPGIVAPLATSAPAGGGKVALSGAVGVVAQPPPAVALRFPAMDVAQPRSAAPGGAPKPLTGASGSGTARADYPGTQPRAHSGPARAATPGPVGAIPLVGDRLPIASTASRGRAATTPVAVALGNAGHANRPEVLGLDLAMPDLGPPPEVYANRAPEIRKEVLVETGGSAETEHAVEIALDWLARHQGSDGKWDGTRYDEGCGKCPGRQRVVCDTALTGLSVLCFVAAGHTHVKDGPYRSAVQRGLDWLVARQHEDGGLLEGESMYSHGIATIALAEAYGMTHDPVLERPVRAAAEFIAGARNRRAGGWRYRPGQAGDTSVMGWQVMALKSASRGGIDISREALQAAAEWLELVHRPRRVGTFAYQPNAEVTPAMTAEAMFISQLLGAKPVEPRMLGAAEYLLENLPAWEPDANTYYWYYATLALFQHQGDAWSTWNEAVKNVLLEHQAADGAAAGSWSPDGQWAVVGGRVYQTAIATLTLEVYYRYLPLYVLDPDKDAPRAAPAGGGP